MDILYFDNAATSWPKPEEMQAAMNRYIREIGGSPGRSGHRLSIEAGRVILDAREAVALLFGVDDPSRIVFTKNATEALNIAVCSGLGQLGGILVKLVKQVTASVEEVNLVRRDQCPLRQWVALDVLDYGTVDTLRRLFPEELSRKVRPLARKLFVEGRSLGILDKMRFLRAGNALDRFQSQAVAVPRSAPGEPEIMFRPPASLRDRCAPTELDLWRDCLVAYWI